MYMAERWLPWIDPGFPVFLGDGTDAFGAVRSIDKGRGQLIVNVENAGDFKMPLAAIVKVVSGEKKIVVDWSKLDSALQDAIRHAMDEEDFPPEGEDEVEFEPPLPSDEEADDVLLPTHTESLRAASPPDELPGRDLGSRYGAPPSITNLPRKG
jgi:hypothetical protein